MLFKTGYKFGVLGKPLYLTLIQVSTAFIFQPANSELPSASVSKGILVLKSCYENEFALQENVCRVVTHFYKNDFVRRLVFTLRQDLDYRQNFIRSTESFPFTFFLPYKGFKGF